jgi:hypothetical protein
LSIVNARRVAELKTNYAVRLIEILRILGQAAERSEENFEAVRQLERVLLAAMEFPALPKDSDSDQSGFP